MPKGNGDYLEEGVAEAGIKDWREEQDCCVGNLRINW